MAITQEVTLYDFEQAFKRAGRENTFTSDALLEEGNDENPDLKGVWYDATRHYLMATDGCTLAAIKIQPLTFTPDSNIRDLFFTADEVDTFIKSKGRSNIKPYLEDYAPQLFQWVRVFPTKNISEPMPYNFSLNVNYQKRFLDSLKALGAKIGSPYFIPCEKMGNVCAYPDFNFIGLIMPIARKESYYDLVETPLAHFYDDLGIRLETPTEKKEAA